jgi:hypothetical protein
VLAQIVNVQIVIAKIDVIAVIEKQHVSVVTIVNVAHNKKTARQGGLF